MANAMMTGMTGLQSHQKMIEVVGNNLANLNTVGYRQKTAVFSDVMYDTLRGGSSGVPGVSGGTNPLQVGTGSKLAGIRTSMNSGGMQSTGNELDLALDGDGYFVLNNGTQNLYTRAGTFQIDKNGMLVDTGTGYPVQRFGALGENNEGAPSFQIGGNSNINIPLGANVPGRQTSTAFISGNLPANGQVPTAQVISTNPWLVGGTAATGTTLINDLDFVTTAYQAGDSISISGTNADGSSLSVSFPVGPTTTVSDLLAAINGDLSGATASLGADGKLAITADSTGKSFLSLSMTDATGNAGGATFGSNRFLESRTGAAGVIVRGGVPIYDASGGVHTVNYEFQRQADGTWDMRVIIDPVNGTVVDGTYTGLTFGSDGAFSHSTGSGSGDSTISIRFTGQTEPTTFTIDLTGGNTPGAGLFSFSGDPSTSAAQDGYANGILTSVQIETSGIIQGIASNGAQFPIAQLAIGNFRNPQGLTAIGDNFFTSSLASGDVKLGAGGANGNALIRAGQLEQSNVDIAIEFTRLIVAQRGFSANSRTITVSNDLLQELTNLIR